MTTNFFAESENLQDHVDTASSPEFWHHPDLVWVYEMFWPEWLGSLKVCVF